MKLIALRGGVRNQMESVMSSSVSEMSLHLVVIVDIVSDWLVCRVGVWLSVVIGMICGMSCSVDLHMACVVF